MTTAIILIGHGSLRSASGASMIRIAARLRAEGLAALVEPAFLNYSRPTLADAVAKCAAAGATSLVIQPYFLIEGVYVRNDLPALIRRVAADYPGLSFAVAPVLGDHPALVDLARDRAGAALNDLSGAGPTHLLLMAHGTPLARANAPLGRVAAALADALALDAAAIAYLDCNRPDIPAGFERLVAAGARRIVALPYFLHLGRHVAEDLPGLVAAAQSSHPGVAIALAHHLDYDPRLARAVADRVATRLPTAAPIFSGEHRL
jgi:sirohydrochlorin ferrochelatase